MIFREERVTIVLSLTYSLSPEMSLEKKVMNLQLGSGVTGLYSAKYFR